MGDNTIGGRDQLPHSTMVATALTKYLVFAPPDFCPWSTPCTALICIKCELDKYSSVCAQGEFHDRHAGGSLQRADAAHEKEADPNDEWDMKAVREWLQYADFVSLPELMPFDSVEHLAVQLAGSTRDFLYVISNNICARNRETLRQLLVYWRRRLVDIARLSPNKPY